MDVPAFIFAFGMLRIYNPGAQRQVFPGDQFFNANRDLQLHSSQNSPLEAQRDGLFRVVLFLDDGLDC